MAGSTATVILTNIPSEADPAVAACETWQACHAEHEGLTRRWQKLETHLVRQHNWFRLSRRQRAAIPEAAELDAIDDRLDVLHAQNQNLLLALPRIAATTAQGLALKLAVAAEHVPPEENREAHHLIKSALRDLRTIARITPE